MKSVDSFSIIPRSWPILISRVEVPTKQDITVISEIVDRSFKELDSVKSVMLSGTCC